MSTGLPDVPEEVEDALTPEQVQAEVFRISKHGLAGVAPEDFVAHVASVGNAATTCDERGWTPLLWAAFHGHWQVRASAFRWYWYHHVGHVTLGVGAGVATPWQSTRLYANAGDVWRCVRFAAHQVAEILLDNDGARDYRAWMLKAPESDDAHAQRKPVNSPLHWAAFKVRVPACRSARALLAETPCVHLGC